MQYNIDTGTFQVVMESADINAIVGESARIEVGEAINYIRSGQAEIGEAVQQGIASFDSNATQKTLSYNTNAGNRLSEYNSNADNKLEAYNNNATAKTNAYNQNDTEKTSAYNTNAQNKLDAYNLNDTSKTNAFNQNATDKTDAFNNNATSKTADFNTNATNKTTAFNNNASEKQAAVDASALAASQSAVQAKQWAIGDPSEPTGNSAKYWAEQASSTLSGLTSRVSTIEDKIPSDASSSNRLADKNWVENKGYITGINSGDVTAALGYTPYNSSNPDGYQTASDVATAISGKQDTLVSGTNIKTINGSSVLGSGDLSVTAQSVWGSITGTLSNQADLQNALNAKSNDSAVAKLSGNQTIAGTKTFSSSPILPTPATSDNSTKGATTAFIVNVLKAIYPVGSCFIGTTSTCPLASFFGTWTLKSTGIVTSVDSTVAVAGNGKALGLIGNKSGGTINTVSLIMDSVGGLHSSTTAPESQTMANNPSPAYNSWGLKNGSGFGVSTDTTKSGLVGTASSTTYTVNIWERTA